MDKKPTKKQAALLPFFAKITIIHKKMHALACIFYIKARIYYLYINLLILNLGVFSKGSFLSSHTVILL